MNFVVPYRVYTEAKEVIVVIDRWTYCDEKLALCYNDTTKEHIKLPFVEVDSHKRGEEVFL